MKKLSNTILRNLVGLSLLLLAHFLTDVFHFSKRTGFNKTSPYIFLLLLYGWIVFHNRILFERLYLKGKKVAYFSWAVLFMAVSSLNMHYIIVYGFNINFTFPHILSFWLYTLAGLAVFIIYKNFSHEKKIQEPVVTEAESMPALFHFSEDGVKHQLPVENILWIESLENYVKIITAQKTYLARLSMKEAEETLPKPVFIRISRSCIVNARHVSQVDNDSITVRNQQLKIGKVFKKYFEEQFVKLKK